jgi:hypothetical protein
MLVIRAKQRQALAEGRRAAYVDRLAAHVRALYPEAVWSTPPEDLRRRLDAAVTRALGYGLATEAQAAYFVELTFLLGERFDEDPAYPWAREILDDASLGGDAKKAALAQRLRPF